MQKARIEVFVMSYNRSSFLKSALMSIMNQTLKNIKVTVVDNASTDDTEHVIKKMQENYPNLNYYRQEKHLNLFWDNLKKAQELVSAEYVAFFHDDDVIHPQYLEIALRLIEKYKNVDLICTDLNTFKDDDELCFNRFSNVNYVVFKKKKKFISYIYAAFFCGKPSLCFPNLIYKTENVKNLIMNYDIGGKAGDKPFVVSSLKNGKIIQIREPHIFNYRIHSGQDTNCTRIDPNPNQIIEHQKFFKKNASKIWYNAFALDWLEFLYDWGNKGKTKKEQREFLKYAFRKNVLGICSLSMRFGLFKFISEKINLLLKKCIRNKLKKIRSKTLYMDDETKNIPPILKGEKNILMGEHVYIQNKFETEIGSFSFIGNNVSIGDRETSEVFINSFEIAKKYFLKGENFERKNNPCIIGHDVAVGDNVTIFNGISIGDGARIYPNSVVTENVPPYAIVLGSPSKILKYRYNEQIIKKLLELKWWNLDDETIKKIPLNDVNEMIDFLSSYKKIQE